jgi:hypothetical protein
MKRKRGLSLLVVTSFLSNITAENEEGGDELRRGEDCV